MHNDRQQVTLGDVDNNNAIPGTVRILIANYEFPPIGGGASKVSFELARSLVSRGHEVIVLTGRYGKLPASEILEGIRVHRVWSWRNGMHDCGIRGAITFLICALPKLRRILAEHEIDVVHYFFGLPTGLLSLYSHGLKRIPYIVSLRGSDVPLYDLDSKKLLFMHRLTRRLSHFIWRNAAGVFAVSNGLRELAEASFPDVDVGVIYNGTTVLEGAEKRRAADSGDIRLICVARLIQRKGIHHLLDALAAIPLSDWRLTIVGTGPSEAALAQRAESCGIAGKVKFAGYCSREQVQAHYLESDIFVLPTNSDAFANVILEAMSAALPVIASSVGGVAEAVADGETGILVAAREPQQLAAAIMELATNTARRRKLGQRGQQRARDVFAWDRIAGRYVTAYENAILPAVLTPQEQPD